MEMIECPFCTGEVPQRAQKCKHCGEWLNETSRQAAALRGVSSGDLVRRYVPKIEALLKEKFHAEGAGVVQQMISVSHLLPEDVQSHIRWIGHIRNQVAHSEDFEIEDRELFASRCQKTLDALEQLSSRSSPYYTKTQQPWQRWYETGGYYNASKQRAIFSYLACPQCHEESPRNSRYCIKCGRDLHAAAEQPAQPEAAAEGMAPFPRLQSHLSKRGSSRGFLRMFCERLYFEFGGTPKGEQQRQEQQVIFSYLVCPQCHKESPRNSWHCINCGGRLSPTA